MKCHDSPPHPLIFHRRECARSSTSCATFRPSAQFRANFLNDPRSGFRTAPRRPKFGQNRADTSRGWLMSAQNRQNVGQDCRTSDKFFGPTLTKVGPKSAKLGLESTRLTQNRPNLDRYRPSLASFRQDWPSVARMWPEIGPNWLGITHIWPGIHRDTMASSSRPPAARRASRWRVFPQARLFEFYASPWLRMSGRRPALRRSSPRHLCGRAECRAYREAWPRRRRQASPTPHAAGAARGCSGLRCRIAR